LDLQDISLSFGGVQALQEANAPVFSGEVVALIGPNGAGKTTLLNVASGLIRPSGGEVLLQGKPVKGLAPHEIAARGVGRTFQAVQIYNKLTVIENMLLGCHIHGGAGFTSSYLHTPGERREEAALRGRALALLAGAGLAEKADIPAEQLSLIEQKLLEFSRALALSPNILLLDEPAGGLNPRETEQIISAVALLRKKGMGILLVEHDMNVVMRLADRVVVLNYGQVIATGTPREIQQNELVKTAYLGTRKIRSWDR
jgi:ABC-type branched-subunit amino acid transport system ATPase component